MSIIGRTLSTRRLLPQNREKILKQLAARLTGRVEKAWIFGSYARGDYRPDSDIDLILVTETKRPFVDRGQDFRDLFKIFPDLDILVYTPAELERLTNSPNGFWKKVLAEKLVLPVSGIGIPPPGPPSSGNSC